TQKSAWFTALAEGGVAIKIDPVERAALPNWIGQRLGMQGQRVAPGEDGRRSLQFVAERVEGNLLAAHQEIQKLGLLYPQGVLSFEQIHDAVLNVARYDVFKLNEAMLTGDAGRLARMLDGL
ncbi:MAG: DNA polymerase III subunit delta, partial [Paraburkholderia tropica]